MARNTRKIDDAGNAALNDVKAEQAVGFDTMQLLAEIDWRALVIKGVIGYVFAMTAFVAANNVAVMLALLTSIVWLQYVIFFAVLAALAVGVIAVTPVVANTVYDAGAYVGGKCAEGYAAARAWLSTKRMPTFGAPSTVQ